MSNKISKIGVISLLLLAGGVLFFLLSCNGGTTEKPRTEPTPPVRDISVPVFQADTAYRYIEKQLAFGPRVPNTPAHAACADWIIGQLESFGAKVTTQPAVVTAFNNTRLNMVNIIASFQPEKQRRVMLTAHWDTRPFADEDSIRKDEPIPGANDGGSGVGVLLEIARILGQDSIAIGVDIVFWDAEDYGNSDVPNSYCLGSQYWAENKHKPGYTAMYGINLDMVGAKNAVFSKEGHSLQYAPNTVEKVWRQAQLLGFGQYFSIQRTDPIIDDHVYVSAKGGIGTIDIIDQPEGRGFFKHWHTHGDDISVISKETLQAVGQTLLAVVYKEE
ncbi:MAG: M28 family peptidase [Bacteroidia bacterium]|nr:M28 family peptidase [Bacteroidia bacterium]